jgi:hypothetical protein
MKSLRNLALAGTLAIAAALSSGAANAAPVPAAPAVGVPAATESAITPVFHFGGHHHGHRRLCHVPFFKLVQWFGYWQARMIKRRCFRHYYGGY